MYYVQSDRMFTQKAEGKEKVLVPLHNISSTGERSHSPEDGETSKAIIADCSWGERDIGGPVDFRTAMQEFTDMRRELSNLSRTKSRGGETSATRRSTARTDLESQPTNAEQDEGNDDDDDDFALSEFLKDGHFEKRTADNSAKKVGVVYKNLTVEGVGATATFVKTLPGAIMGTFGPDLYKLCARFIPGLPVPGASGAKRDLIHDFTGVVRNGEMLLVLGRPGSGCSTFLKTIANKRGGYAGITGDVHYGGISAEEQSKSFRGEVNYNEEDDQHFATLTVEQTLKFSLLNKTKKHEKGEIPIIISALLKMFGIGHTRHTLVGDAYVRGVSGGERKRVSIAETLATKSTVVAWDNSTRGLDASTALDYANSLRVMTDISDRTTLVTLYQAGEGIYELMDKVMVIDAGHMVYQGPAKEAKKYFESIGYYCPPRQTTADFLTACTDPTERRFRDDFDGPIPKGPIELENAFRKSKAYEDVLRDVEEYEKVLRETDHADAREFKETVKEGKSKTVSKRSPYTVSFVRQVLACTQREFWLTMGDRSTLYTKFFIIVSNGLIVGSLFYGQPLNTDGSFSRGGTAFFSILFLGWLQLTELMKAVSGRTIIARHNDYAFYRPSAVVIGRIVQDFPLLLLQVVVFAIIMYFMAGLDVEAGKFFIYALFIYVTTICITALYRMFAALSPTIDDAVRFSGIALNLLIIYTGYVIPKPVLLSEYIWFGWIYYINPVAYSFEAVLTNEFSDRVMACADDATVPRGPGYTNPAYQGCTLAGSQVGSLDVNGSTYLETSFQYSRSNLWRNFGVVVAFTVLYILITAAAAEVFDFTSGGGGALEFKKSKKAKQAVKEATSPDDEEKAVEKRPADLARSASSGSTVIGSPRPGGSVSQVPSEANATAATVTDGALGSDATIHPEAPETRAGGEVVAADAPTHTQSHQSLQKHEEGQKPTRQLTKEEEAFQSISGSESMFTWKDVEYTVPYLGGEKKLLNKVSGFAKPGVMTALMGASGAGKTTLLNTLAQRQKMGVVKGDMLVDGRKLGIEFQRGTGFCEQMDLHDGTATIREALEFSAILRQERDIPRSEKIEYVDKIIDLLELSDMQDALIRSLGVEQRKRVTIGVELAAKPNLLLFLDEPTSGLDSQSAYSIVRFLRKLAEAGQAIVCTIHQPSSILIQQFDRILALNPGGNVIYNGPVGENGKDVIKYFGDRGIECPPAKNVAEFILETAAKRPRGKDGKKINWNDEWLQSSNKKEIDEEIETICSERSKVDGPAADTQHDFASPTWLQITELTKRTFINYWRDPSYLYGKLFVSVIIGIFNGFTFWQLGTSIIDLQNRMFTTFLILLIPPTIVNAVVPKFYQARALWEARELPSRIYGWVAFCTANIVAEIPIAIVGATVYWALWYWPTGLPSDSSTSGYVYLMTMLFFLFQASWGQWICAFAPSFTVISNVLPFFFVMFSLFNGVIRPYAQLSVFWKYWMYWVNPATYYIGGTVAATLKSVVVTCAPEEAAYFNPPPGSTCKAYAEVFVDQFGGYLLNPNESTNCGYCQYATGVEYMATLNVKPSDQWRNMGIFLAFCISNWALVYFFIYTVRIKGWTFGFGPLFNTAGKGVGAVRGLFKGKNKGGDEEENEK